MSPDSSSENSVNSSQKWAYWIGVPAVIIVLVGGIWVLVGLMDSDYYLDPDQFEGASVDQHWHASYQVDFCGEVLAPFPASEGEIHSHGDGLIHIHPKNKKQAKEHANLSRFIESVGGTMTNDSLKLPKQNLDSTQGCDGKQAGLAVYVNGKPVEGPAEYTPQNNDTIRIVVYPME